MKTGPFRGSLARLLLSLNLLAAAPLAMAQLEADPPAAAPTPNVRLDIEALLQSPEVTPDRITGPVWELASQPGRYLLQIPLIVEPVEQPAELSSPPVDVRGGRFIAWRVPEADGRSGASSGGFDPREFDEPWQRPAAPAVAGTEGEVPAGAPRLTRELTIRPDGTLSWELDRAIPGANVANETSDYALRVRPDLLHALAPERPERQVRSEQTDMRAYREQQIEQQRAFREAMTVHRERADRVRDLPGEFTVPMPPRVWAVFEVSQNVRDLTLEGEPPLPWVVSTTAFNTIRATAGGGSRSGDRLEFDDLDRVAALGAAVSDGHPLTREMVARAIAASGMTQAMAPNDPLFDLVRALLRDGDATTRRVLLSDLVEAQRTPAIDRLLADATAYMDPQQKLATIRGALAEVRSAEQIDQALAVVNRALADEHGADAGEVLRELALATQRITSADDSLALLTTGTQFELLSGDRTEQAIRGVLRAAAEHPLAGSWLNHRLLGSQDEALVRQTLTLLDEAKVVAPRPEQRAEDFGYEEEFLRPDLPRGFEQYEAPAPEQPQQQQTQPTQPADAAEEAGFTLPGFIPLESADHALIRLLDAEDAGLRDLAWQALPKFTIDRSSRRSSYRDDGTDQGPTRIQRILQSAFRQTGTPKSLPAFLDNLQDNNQATQAMAATVVYASPDVAAEAATRLHDSGRPVEQAVVEMTPEQRGIFARRVYEAIQNDVPEVAGVLRDPSRQSQVARWFGQQVAEGNLPAPGAFAQQFTEDHLLSLAGSNDQELSRAAIAVLVNSVGGGKQDIDALVNRFAQQGDHSVAGLRTVWGPVKQEIYQRKLQSAAGPYRVRLEVIGSARQPGEYGGPDEPVDYGRGILGLGEGGNAPAGSRGQAVPLGIMNLVVDARGIRLANDAITLSVPQTHLAIRVDQPNQLKNFGKPELADLPLGQVREPLDLFPQDGGAWSGQVELDNGQTLAMTLEPAQQQTTP